MAKKYYVVWAGRNTGVFTSWTHTKKQVDKFPRARYKSFKTQQEAEAAYTAGRSETSSTTTKKNKNKKKLDVPDKGEVEQIYLDIGHSANFDVKIFCDGACDPNPGEAGSGLAVYRGGKLAELWYGLYNAHGTNNSAELNALYQALHIAKEEIGQGNTVQILCDSKYSINCVTNWAFNWERKGWKRKIEGDIKNLEIIQQSHELYKSLKGKVVVSHVSAHVGIKGNELADRMSAYGIDQQEADLCLYRDILDIDAILKFRSG